MDVFRLDGEVDPSDSTALEVVYELGQKEQQRLEKEAEEIENQEQDCTELLGASTPV
jgi:hypothetical protein